MVGDAEMETFSKMNIKTMLNMNYSDTLNALKYSDTLNEC